MGKKALCKKDNVTYRQFNFGGMVSFCMFFHALIVLKMSLLFYSQDGRPIILCMKVNALFKKKLSHRQVGLSYYKRTRFLCIS